MSLFALTLYWHWSFKGCTNHGSQIYRIYIFVDNSLLKEKVLSKDHNGERKQWHEQPAIVKSNLKLILVFVKHFPGNLLLSVIFQFNALPKDLAFNLEPPHCQVHCTNYTLG